MNRKIGVLTYHNSDNFGAVLQCYALQEYLSSKNYDVEIINFKPKRNKVVQLLSDIKNHFKYVKNNFSLTTFYLGIFQFKELLNQTKKFNLFRSNWLKISKLYDARITNHDFSDYDVIITGSDQIWNSINGHFKSYFLIGYENFQGKKIAYAACRGVKKVLDEDLKILNKALNLYDWIGVRDDQTKKFVKQVSNSAAKIVCDPSMLIDYSKIVNENSPFEFKYILVYVLGNEIKGNHLNVISQIKTEHPDAKVVAAYLTKKNPNHFSWADIHIYNAGPIEWLNLIKHTEFFYTDSFHGILFALKFKRDFLAYYSEEKRASRLIHISKRLEIGDRIVSNFEQANLKKSFGPIQNYNRINMKYFEFVESSKDLLDKTLNDFNIG